MCRDGLRVLTSDSSDIMMSVFNRRLRVDLVNVSETQVEEELLLE